jgi:inhibitor of the pro-sigma K processing machinery
MKLLRLLGRSLIGLLFLALLKETTLMPGFLPGANPITALVLGTLGAPGFGLMLLAPVLL